MHFMPQPGPARAQARIDVYDAGNPAFPTAASLTGRVFDATNIEAGPYLGNLIGNDGFFAINGMISDCGLSALLPMPAGLLYFAYRSSSNFRLLTALH